MNEELYLLYYYYFRLKVVWCSSSCNDEKRKSYEYEEYTDKICCFLL